MNGLIPGLLSPEQQAMAEQRARREGLLNLGFALLQSSQGQPGQGRPRLGQIIGQAGPVGIQAYQSSFDDTLRQLLAAQQMQDLQRKRQQEAAQQQAISSYIETLPEDQRARFQAFPTQAAEAMFREPKQAPGVVGEYNAALEAGLIPPGTTLTQYVEMKKPPAPSATAIAGGEMLPFMRKAQESQATTFNDIQKSGMTAQNSLRTVNQLEKYLSKVDTGATAALKQFAGNFGIETKGLSDIQAATALINRLVPQQRPPGSGTMSDADLALFKQSLPRIINQPGGNQQIINSIKEVNKYLIEEGKIATDVLAGKITPEEGARRMQSLANPLENITEQAPAPQGVRVRRIR